MEIKAKYGYRRIDEIIKQLKSDIGIEDLLKNLRASAIKLEKGHNSEGILVEMYEDGEQKGRVYATPDEFMTNNGVSYLFFEYFGTGQYAELEHVGKTAHFIASGFREWFIPVASVPKRLNYAIITINNTEFYLAHGVPANHFITDAEFETREQNKEIVKNKLEEMFKKICK